MVTGMTAALLDRPRSPFAGEIVGIYGRNSHGDKAPIAHQLRIGHRWCDRQGATPHADYTDEVSASPWSKKTREGWPALMADVRARAITLVWLWEASRGDRTLSSWALFLEMCQAAGVRIWVDADERAYDPRIPADWTSLAGAGVTAQGSSAEKSRAVLRGIGEAAMDGKPHAQAPIGLAREYDPDTGAYLRTVIDQDRSPVPAEIFERVGRRDPVAAIRRDLMARGILSPAGSPVWHRSAIVSITRNKAYIGVRVHKGTEYPGAWPALVTPALFRRANAVLDEQARQHARPAAQKYTLSYHATCGECGGQLRGEWTASGPKSRTRRKVLVYTCAERSCATISMAPLDAYIHQLVLWYLTADGIPRLPAADDARIEAAQTELDELEGRRAKLQDDAAAGLYDADPAFIQGAVARLAPKIEDARRRATAPPDMPLPIDPASEWDGALPHARKVVLRMTLGSIEVFRSEPGRRAPTGGIDPSRVRVTWISGGGLVDMVSWPGHDDEADAMYGQPYRAGRWSERAAVR